MPNPLQMAPGGPPEAPGQDVQMPAPENALMGDALAPNTMPPGAGPPGMPGMPPQMPAPSHRQTVAALHHFHSIASVLQPIAQDTDLGKSDLKGKIIDASAKLVAERVITPAQAVTQLQSVPEKPFDQKGWVMQKLDETMTAANVILDHHAAAFQGQGDLDDGPDDGDHFKAMSSIGDHYKGFKRG